MSSHSCSSDTKLKKWLPPSPVAPVSRLPIPIGLYYSIGNKTISSEENMWAFLRVGFRQGPIGVYRNNTSTSFFALDGVINGDGPFRFRIYIDGNLVYTATGESWSGVGVLQTIPIGQTISLTVEAVNPPVNINFNIMVTESVG